MFTVVLVLSYCTRLKVFFHLWAAPTRVGLVAAATGVVLVDVVVPAIVVRPRRSTDVAAPAATAVRGRRHATAGVPRPRPLQAQVAAALRVPRPVEPVEKADRAKALVVVLMMVIVETATSGLLL